jgi:RNA polymerase sigma factor (TIGR02999 family)
MPDPEISLLLSRAAAGNLLPRLAADRIFTAAYDELHAIAEREMQHERVDHTLQPTALLNEAYQRIVGSDVSQLPWENRAHFFGIAAQAMRQVLIDHARRRGTAKRGAGWTRLSVSDCEIASPDAGIDAIDLDRVLAKLTELHPRMARVVELRVFGGLSGREIALALGVSRKTIVEDWRVAVLWLRAELAGEVE